MKGHPISCFNLFQSSSSRRLGFLCRRTASFDGSRISSSPLRSRKKSCRVFRCSLGASFRSRRMSWIPIPAMPWLQTGHRCVVKSKYGATWSKSEALPPVSVPFCQRRNDPRSLWQPAARTHSGLARNARARRQPPRLAAIALMSHLAKRGREEISPRFCQSRNCHSERVGQPNRRSLPFTVDAQYRGQLTLDFLDSVGSESYNRLYFLWCW